MRMLLIVGTYRKRAYIERALDSIGEYVTGVTSWVAVDDSGDPNHVAWLRDQGYFNEVVDVGGRGYNAAMQEICRVGRREEFAAVWEEDFQAVAPINLDAMRAQLERRPHLAQVALLRSAHFRIEHDHGGVLGGLEARLPGSVLGEVDGLIEQTGTFTCNPSVWRREVFDSWPRCRWSEDRKRDELLEAGYRFAFVPGVKVAHDGVRSGKGY
jgi:hypothetical protein